MANELQPIDVTDMPEVLRLAEQVRRTQTSAVLRRGDGEELAVLSPLPATRQPGDQVDDIWAGYDPEAVRKALRASAGALKGVDKEELLRDIYEARSQDSAGRPAER